MQIKKDCLDLLPEYAGGREKCGLFKVNLQPSTSWMSALKRWTRNPSVIFIL